MDNNIGNARRDYAAIVGGFTQKDAAEYFGVSLSTYKKWEQGQGKLNGGILGEVADKYGVTVDYLLGIAPKPKPQLQLAPNEQRLIRLFRKMDATTQEKFLDMAGVFVSASEKDGAGSERDAALAGRSVI